MFLYKRGAWYGGNVQDHTLCSVFRKECFSDELDDTFCLKQPRYVMLVLSRVDLLCYNCHDLIPTRNFRMITTFSTQAECLEYCMPRC